MFHSILHILLLLESVLEKRKEMHYITTCKFHFVSAIALSVSPEKVPFLWSLRRNRIQNFDFCANGYRWKSVAVAVVERRRFGRNGWRFGYRYRFRQSREAETSGVSNCLRIMLQPKRSSGSKNFLCFFCFLFLLLFLLVLFCYVSSLFYFYPCCSVV